jgi:hypothetical protein
MSFLLTYPEQLNTPEWQSKRKDILKRDYHQCTSCNNKTILKGLKCGVFGYQTQDILKRSKRLYIRDIKTGDFYAPQCSSSLSSNFGHSGVLYFNVNEDGWVDFVATMEPNAQVNIEISIVRDFCVKVSQSEVPGATDGGVVFGISQAAQEENQLFYKMSVPMIQEIDITGLIFTFVAGLHIHHHYYQEDRMAWEYPDKALTTLCWQCHETLHKNEKVKVLDSKGRVIGERTTCSRCFGAGVFPEYSHVKSGICFRCHGERFENT